MYQKKPTSVAIRFLLLSGLLLATILCHGQALKKTDTPSRVAVLRSNIEKVMKETGTPAVGVALVKGDSTLWMAGLGKANVEDDIDADENTLFRIGSISKMFVALAILKLQEEGRISLKDTVRHLAPDIEFDNPWRETAPILVAHLLEHTTGWDDLHFTDYALNDPKLTLKEGLDHHPHSRTSRWMPGTRMAYCNSGPPVAAYIIEKLTGQSFEDYIQQQFFDPMGMENMTYFLSEPYQRQGATLYIKGKPQNYWHISVRPSGAINASLRDMVRMLEFFIHKGRVNGAPLISEASLRRMETPGTTTGAKAGLEYGYGLANYATPHNNYVYRTHQGGVNGGQADLSYLPGHDVGYVVMINSGNGSALYRISQLIRNYQTKHLADEAFNHQDIAQKPGQDISGYYVPVNPRMQIMYYLERLMNVKQLRFRDSLLYSKPLLAGGSKKYVPVGNGKYVALESGKIAMVLATDPLAGQVVHEGGLVLKPVSPTLAFGQIILVVVWVLGMASAILFGIIWTIRYMRGTLPGGPNISVRLWPLLASLLFLVVFILLIISPVSSFEVWGTVSIYAVSITVSTISFGLVSIWSVITVVKSRRATIPKWAYWHSAVLSGLHLVVTCYLLYHNIIGLRTWAY